MGALAARSLASRGHTVYASMRDPDGTDAKRAAALRDEADGEIRTLELDILDDASVEAAVGRIIGQSHRIDVLVNNAGHLYYGITEAFTPDQVMSSYATNCTGAHRATRAVLPHMRRQREGLLLWIGSGSTRAIPPYLGPYTTAKAAFDALAESFAWDVESLGVDTTIIHPGVFTEGTSHFADAAQANDAARASEYDGTPAKRHLDSMLEDTERLFSNGRSLDPRSSRTRSFGLSSCPAVSDLAGRSPTALTSAPRSSTAPAKSCVSGSLAECTSPAFSVARAGQFHLT
jgi:NAD(P)-dependent dehydrogenase (short-subunit alcohol dehydrogenase family)